MRLALIGNMIVLVASTAVLTWAVMMLIRLGRSKH